MGTLVIVESPAKARTIGKFLGRGYTVKASIGHVRDLPKSQFGVDIENNFAPHYITIRGKGKILNELRESVKKSDRVLLATDPDREGEAISWHLVEALKLDPNAPNRIQFHEITKEAVKKALKSPRTINRDLVDAYQARRVLDRIVGYELSPLLWKKVKAGLSAGRVQSVAVRLITDREQEIARFQPEEYWTITAVLSPERDASARRARFRAKLWGRGGEKLELPDEQTVKRVLADLENVEYVVKSVKRGQRRRRPAPPFTTSTLQQEASRKLRFSARKTMNVAQQLYEGLNIGSEGTVGLITYMRTDSANVAAAAQQEARRLIDEKYGSSFRPAKPPVYRAREGAQQAHEAIRPTSVWREPQMVKPYLTRDQYRLYKLIWERFVASQMADALFDTLTVDIAAGDYVFRASGSTLRFEGFMKVYMEGTDEEAVGDEEQRLPNDLEPDQHLKCAGLEPEQHFTQPPPRYTEATLVKALEEQGVGRPSTYAQIIDTIVKRGYVEVKDRRFYPTELGTIVVDLLKKHFPHIIDVEFTARMEAHLDRIEEGAADWVEVVDQFYRPFEEALQRARKEMRTVEIQEEVTDEVCDNCGRNLVVKWGRFGKFLACPGYPECKFTKPILQDIGIACPKCGEGHVVERRTRKGRIFYGCSRYPDCDFTSWQRPAAARCPRCGAYMVEQRRREELVRVTCSDKACGFSAAPDALPVTAGAEKR